MNDGYNEFGMDERKFTLLIFTLEKTDYGWSLILSIFLLGSVSLSVSEASLP